MFRLPAFALIFMVLGEWTPLIVMYITPLIPEAVRIPGQVEKEVAKMERTRHERMRFAATTIQQTNFTSQSISQAEPLKSAQHTLLAFSARFNCHAKMWDRLGVTPPTFWLKRNVRKKIEYLKRDDELIRRDGGWRGLERREVERACKERGLDVLGKKEGELGRGLEGWFGGR
jgi:hypothetical protein